MSEAEEKSRNEQSVVNQIKLAKLRYQREQMEKCLQHVRQILQKLSPTITVNVKLPATELAQKAKSAISPTQKSQPQPIPRMPVPRSAPVAGQAENGKTASSSTANGNKASAGSGKAAAIPSRSQPVQTSGSARQPANERSIREETKENPAYRLMLKKAEMMELGLKTLDAEITEVTKEEENNNMLLQYLFMQNMQHTS